MSYLTPSDSEHSAQPSSQAKEMLPQLRAKSEDSDAPLGTRQPYADSDLGRHLKHEAFTPGEASSASGSLKIRLIDYPMLRQIAWSTHHEAELTPREAFALYERNWRHIDPEAINRHERELVEQLTKTEGKGVLLV